MKVEKTAALDALKNTFVTIHLDDGSEAGIDVKGTLSFWHLKQLEARRPELAERYFAITGGDRKRLSELDVIAVLYVAYVCANLDETELIDEDTFTILLGYDRAQVKRLSAQLVFAKKKTPFAGRS